MLILFPHQLYDIKFWPHDIDSVVVVEDPLFFHDPMTKILMHKQKIYHHRASMRAFADELGKNSALKVCYLEFFELCDGEGLYRWLAKHGITKIEIFELTDYLLERRLKRYAKEYLLEVLVHRSPNFITPSSTGLKLIRDMKKPLMADFYKSQRINTGILMQGMLPLGGKWSFDEQNRERLPKDILSRTAEMDLEKSSRFTIDAYRVEAKAYVQEHFAEAPGEINPLYPITRDQAQEWLDDFINNYLENFGKYEDSIAKDQLRIFHSVFSPIINVGLLQPEEIVQKILTKTNIRNMPINSLEGFLRQIIGWREFVRIIYLEFGTKARNQNFFKARRKLPNSFWDGTTGIDPVDVTIQKVLRTGYCHHIERLMVLGNFMLLCEFDPNDVYRWFMEMFVDSYDWVMVPNVYGMSQFADGGLFATKPYISGSNYILKMSDYERGEWCEIWDGLYWRFIDKHSGYFEQNARTGFAVKMLKKMTTEKRDYLVQRAEQYLLQIEQ
jgi:deoxyribodipyrimidine photolyase-related protein